MSDHTSSVWVFFYGSFIDSRMLAEHGVEPEAMQVARLTGFDIHFQPLATLVPSERDSVYGILCRAAPRDLERLYAEEWVRAYTPRAVIVEAAEGKLVPALCYVAPPTEPQSPSVEYLERIARPAREHGFPDWYLARLESFRAE